MSRPDEIDPPATDADDAATRRLTVVTTAHDAGEQPAAGDAPAATAAERAEPRPARHHPTRRFGLQAARTASRARRTWIALAFFPVFAVYVVIDALRDLRDVIDSHRRIQVKARDPFRRPAAMGPIEDRSMADVVRAVEAFPFRPEVTNTNLVFFRDNGADAIGSLLSPNPDMTTIPHRYPPTFQHELMAGHDGVMLAGMRAMHDHQAPAVVICHGLLMTKNFDVIIELARRAYEQWGFHVVTLDLRGWGQSAWTTDAPSSGGYYEGRDVVAVARMLQEDPRVTSVAGVGFSLGGGSMLNAAHVSSTSEDHPLDGGVVTVSAPTDIGVALQHIAKKPSWRDPYFGLWHVFRAAIKSNVRRKGLDPSVSSWYDLVRAMGAPYYGIEMEEFCRQASAVGFADEITVPVLDLHSTDDFLLPVQHAYALQDVTADNPWVHVMVRDAGAHCAFAGADPSWYFSTVRCWLQYWATPGASSPEDAPLD